MELKAEGVSRRYLRNMHTHAPMRAPKHKSASARADSPDESEAFTVKHSNVFYAVRETNLTLAPGTLTEITGRSGSGKSTLLLMLAGLLAHTAGRVLWGNTDICALDDEERAKLRNEKLGVIPQVHTGLRSLTVLENVTLPCAMYGDADARDAALSLLRSVGLARLKDAYPNELSGGELRRMSIARALVKRPAAILADEPTGDLDDENTRAVLRLLRRCADDGASVLLVTHEREAAAYADRVLRMDGGILTEGPEAP